MDKKKGRINSEVTGRQGKGSSTSSETNRVHTSGLCVPATHVGVSVCTGVSGKGSGRSGGMVVWYVTT